MAGEHVALPIDVADCPNLQMTYIVLQQGGQGDTQLEGHDVDVNEVVRAEMMKML